MKSSVKSRNRLASGTNGTGGETPASRPRIEIDESAGALRVHDDRLFNDNRRAFCRRLVEAVAGRPGVSRIMIDLASASCRVEFAAASASQRIMAESFAASVHEASSAVRDGEGARWWRPSPRWVALTAYALPGQVSLWETLEASPGRTCVRNRALAGDFQRLSHVADSLSRCDNVRSCQANPWSHRLTIDFSPENGVADWFLDQAERSYEDLLALEAHQAKTSAELTEIPHHATVNLVASGPVRWLYLALGGGALVMTVVGLIVPGIPTVPFLLLSSYAFARSSPRINRWLRESRFFGPILIEWEQHGGLSRSSKKKLIGLTAVIILVAVILAPLSPLGLMLILIVAALSSYGVWRMPGISDDPATTALDKGTTNLALLAP